MPMPFGFVVQDDPLHLDRVGVGFDPQRWT
jgi:hypothetical protein